MSVNVELVVCTAIDEEALAASFDFATTSSNDGDNDGRNESEKTMWILDVCLDYFSTSNPFLFEIQELLLRRGLEEEDAKVIQQICHSLAYKVEEGASEVEEEEEISGGDGNASDAKRIRRERRSHENLSLKERRMQQRIIEGQLKNLLDGTSCDSLLHDTIVTHLPTCSLAHSHNHSFN